MSGTLPRSLLIGAIALVMVTSTLFGGALAALTGSGAHPAGSVVHVVILPNGALSAPAPISISGNTYTLTQELNGTIVDERNGSTLDGAGHTLNSTGAGSTAVGVYNATGVTVEDLTITNASIGVSIQNSSQAAVKANDISATKYGVFSDFTTNVSVTGNHLTAAGPSEEGVLVERGSSVTVSGNNAYGLDYGIVTYLIQGALVSGNNVSRTSHGVSLGDGTDGQILGNVADNSTYGIYLYVVTNMNVSYNNALYSVYGIYVSYANTVTGYGNDVEHSIEAGLYLYYDTGVVMGGTLASYSNYGILVEYGGQFDLRGGSAQASEYGFYDEYSSGGRVSGLNAAGSSAPAYLYSANGVVTLQDVNISFAGSGYGLYSTYSSFTMVGGSVYGETVYAIYAEYDHHDTLVDVNGTGTSSTYLLYDEYSGSITVDGGHWVGYEYGVYAQYVGSVTVSGTNVSDGYYAGYTYVCGQVNVNSLTVLGGSLSGSGWYGWYDEDSGTVAVVNGTYQALRYGLELYYEGTVHITGANFQGTFYYGIETGYVGSVHVSGVRVTGTLSDTEGFYDDGSGHEWVSNSSFPGLYVGIYLEDDGPAWVYNVTSRASVYGLYAYYPTSLTVQDSNFNLDNYSLALYGQTLDVLNNSATGTHLGLFAEYANQGTISGNDLANALSYAAWFYYDDNLVVSDNNLSGAGSYALAFDYSTASQAWGNDLSHSLWGFELNNSSGITMMDNRIAGDPWAFSLNNSTGNLFYHNDFINDARWLFKGAVGQNAWADGYPVGGNYWSSYSGKDLNHGPNQNLPGPDGIGDTPYVLGSGNVDPYPLMRPWTSPMLTFTETGLPIGTPWSVTVNGTLLTATAPGTALYPQTNGAYTPYVYTVGAVPGYTAQPAKGNGTYTQTDATIPIHFWTVNYTVTFAETGLPANTSWGVKLSFAGLNATGNASALVLDAANGTWDYQLTSPVGYLASPSSGNVTVKGAALTVSVVFHPITYGVSFDQVGLPVGLNWSVTLQGATLTGPASGDLLASLPNGTYHFTVGTTVVSSALSYDPSPASGNLTVNGTALSLAVTFTAANHPTLFAVTFVPVGLPSGSSFSLAVAGRNYSSVTTNVVVQLANGSYAFGVEAPTGWSVNPVQGVVTVNGTAVSVSLHFQAIPSSSSSSSGLANGEFLGLLALVVVLAILMVVGWLLYLGRRRGGGSRPSPATSGTAPPSPPAWTPTPGEPPQGPPGGSPPGSP